MATKRTAEQLKALKMPDLRNAAREWGVPVAGKQPNDIIRLILSKQNGGKTAATAASNTKVPGAAKPTSGSLTAKPKTPTPMAKPGAAKPAAVVAKPAAKPPVKPVAAKPAAAAPVVKPGAKVPPKPVITSKAPAPLPAGTKPVSTDADAKFKALINSQFNTLSAPILAKIMELQESFSGFQADFEALKEAAGAALTEDAEAPAEEETEEVVEEAPAEEGETMELTQEQIEGASLEELKSIAEQIGVEVKKTDTHTGKGLKARILKFLSEQEAVSEEQPEEGREEVVDTSWIEVGAECIAVMEGEWRQGSISKINAKTNKVTVFIYDPEDESSGWEIEPDVATELAPFVDEPIVEEGAAEEEVVEEEATEEVTEEEVVEE